jgi:uncharacterized protein YkwD
VKRSIGRRIVAATLLMSTLFIGSAAVAPQASAATYSEYEMAKLINEARHYYGRYGLKLNWSLSELARKHSWWMAHDGTIFHTSNLAYKLRNFSWSVAGENVGMGPSIVSLHQAFMASPHHRYNNLYSGFKRFGIGCVWKNGIAYITIDFLG